MVVGDWVNSSYFAAAERVGNLRGLLKQALIGVTSRLRSLTDGQKRVNAW